MGHIGKLSPGKQKIETTIRCPRTSAPPHDTSPGSSNGVCQLPPHLMHKACEQTWPIRTCSLWVLSQRNCGVRVRRCVVTSRPDKTVCTRATTSATCSRASAALGLVASTSKSTCAHRQVNVGQTCGQARRRRGGALCPEMHTLPRHRNCLCGTPSLFCAWEVDSGVRHRWGRGCAHLGCVWPHNPEQIQRGTAA